MAETHAALMLQSVCVTDCSFRRRNQQQAGAQTEVRNLLTRCAALLILVCLFIIYNLTHTLHAKYFWVFFNLPVLVSNSNAERPGCWLWAFLHTLYGLLWITSSPVSINMASRFN